MAKLLVGNRAMINDIADYYCSISNAALFFVLYVAPFDFVESPVAVRFRLGSKGGSPWPDALGPPRRNRRLSRPIRLASLGPIALDCSQVRDTLRRIW